MTFVPAVLQGLTLDPDEVLLVSLRADSSSRLFQSCKALLSPAEADRLARLRRGIAADEFAAGRGCLRLLLSRLLPQNASDILVQTGKHGKPFVPGVEFNVSHSRGLILIALSRSAVLGVDIEAINQAVEVLEVAQDVFAPGELAHLERAAEGAERVQAFFRVWVRKEAVAKAHGQGITLPLTAILVGQGSLAETVVRLRGEEDAEDKCLFLRNIPLPDGFAGALAVSRPDMKLRRVDLQDTEESG